MPTPFTSPGVYVQEVPSGVRAISGVPTSVTAFVGRALRGPVEQPTVVTGYGDYERTFGGLWKESALGFAVRDFFANGGGTAVIVRLDAPDGALDDDAFIGASRLEEHTGLYALERADIVNLLVIPPYDLAGGVGDAVHQAAARYAATRRAMYVIDGAADWTTAADAVAGVARAFTIDDDVAANVALSFPRLLQPNPFDDDRLAAFATAGAVAGVMARTDARRGVWKAPAGLEATVRGVSALEIALTDDDLGQLTRAGVNALRSVPRAGVVIWGARTLQGADRHASEWKYVPVRRTALFIEESVLRGTRWVVFEPNDEPLWAQLRHTVGAFLHDLFRQGAFQGTKPSEAYFVRCDSSTMTQADIEAGIVNIEIGFAPLKPAEFVVIRVRQVAVGTQSDADGRHTAPVRAIARRVDPYRSFRFRVKWNGNYVAGFRAVAGLKRATEIADRRGSSPARASSRRKGFEPITLERGVTHDVDFERWARAASKAGAGPKEGSTDVRQDLRLEVYNEAGQLALAYTVVRAWVSEYQALPDLDADAHAVAIQTLTLENEGWERVVDLVEPVDPAFPAG